MTLDEWPGFTIALRTENRDMYKNDTEKEYKTTADHPETAESMSMLVTKNVTLKDTTIKIRLRLSLTLLRFLHWFVWSPKPKPCWPTMFRIPSKVARVALNEWPGFTIALRTENRGMYEKNTIYDTKKTQNNKHTSHILKIHHIALKIVG